MSLNRKFHEVGTIAGINKIVNGYKRVSLFNAILGFLIFISAIAVIIYYANKKVDNVYVTKDFGVVEKVKDKKYMVQNHVAMFLQKFFALDPNNYNRSTVEALELIGNDGKVLLNKYREGGWLKNIVQSNMNINVEIDRIAVDMNVYPYSVAFESKMVIQRETKVEKRFLNGRCKVSETSNSQSNPFGMMISNFVITKNSNYDEPKKSGILNN